MRDGLSLQETTQAMDIRDALKREGLAVDALLDTDSKQKIMDSIKETYKAMGESHVSDMDLRKAIDLVLEQRHTFQEPKKDFEHKLLSAYVHRREIGVKYGIPALSLAGLVTGGWVMVASVGNMIDANFERKVEESITSDWKRYTTLSQNAEILKGDDIVNKLQTLEKGEFNRRIATAEENLDDVYSFLAPLRPIEEAVTRENMEEISDTFTVRDLALTTAGNELSYAKEILRNEKRIIGVKTNLDTLIESVRTIEGLSDHIEQKGEDLYNQGIARVNQRDISGAENASKSLGIFQRQVEGLPELIRKFETVYEQAEDVAQSNNAKQKVESTYTMGTAALEQADVNSFSDAVQLLEQYNTILNKEITLEVWGGTEKDHRTHYLNVRATDQNGMPVKFPITDIYRGDTQMVSEWGERVEKSRYQQVGKDKMDNYVIDNENNRIFGIKPIGYLDIDVTMKHDGREIQRQNQIIHGLKR